MPSRAGAKNIAPYIRATFARITDPDLGKKFFDFEDALLKSLELDFLGTMRMLKGYIPVELLLQGDDANPTELEQVFRIELISPKGQVIELEQGVELITAPDHGGNGDVPH